jgi:hypothetical protein
MQITKYQTITNRIRTSSLKKLSNRIRIELRKKSNRTNRTRTKIESNIERIMNYKLFLQLYICVSGSGMFSHWRKAFECKVRCKNFAKFKKKNERHHFQYRFVQTCQSDWCVCKASLTVTVSDTLSFIFLKF